jgi:hypothetical protein
MRTAVALAAALLALCCAAQLPEHAQPRVELIDPTQAQAPRDGIAYRTLTRADFRAKSPPVEVAEHARTMGAYTCGVLIPPVPVQIRVEPDAGGFTARALDFEVKARMDPSCSWWNDSIETTQTDAYILQHEQIHFALFELGARDVTARGRALRTHGRTVPEAHAAFQRALDALQHDAAAALLHRNQDFDRDTSGVHRPEVQRRWLERVQGEFGR